MNTLTNGLPIHRAVLNGTTLPKAILAFLCLLPNVLLGADEVKVTFMVAIHPGEGRNAYIAGNFPGHEWKFQKMKAEGTNIFSIDLELPKGAEYEFKFSTAPNWNSAEKVPEECNATAYRGKNDRGVKLPDHDTVFGYRYGQTGLYQSLEDLLVLARKDKAALDEKLQRIREDEIDPAKVVHRPVGNHLPLRPMKVENGTLLYEDDTEVAVYGVNYQTMLSFERNGLDKVGILVTAKALNDIARTDLRHISRMNQTMIRAHLIPADMSGPDGELRDSPYLDNLDFVIAECGKLGMYFYITMMNEMNNRRYFEDSFLAVDSRPQHWERKHFLTNTTTIEKSRRFITELLNHKNRYNGLRYKDDPTLALVEIINEPGYFHWEDLDNPDVAYHKKHFTDWAKKRQTPANKESFVRFRQSYVKDYVNLMVATVRDAGCEKPVTWNCNWQGRIVEEEDVYQAIAESDVDVISVTAYPLKMKIKGPPWATDADLTNVSALPLIDGYYSQYKRLRWMLGKRFKDKAQVFYEFEANLCKAAYVYPYFARFQRALGAQACTMWTYSLGPTSFHQHAHHYMNYLTAPQKAAGAVAAAEIFKKTPRYTPYPTGVKDRSVWKLTDGEAASSFELDLAIVSTPDVYINAEHVDWRPFEIKQVPKQIIGYGISDFVTYNGKGIYTLDLSEKTIKLEINPDANWVVTPWTKASYDKKKVELDYKVERPMTLRIPGWEKIESIHRTEHGKRTPVPCDKEKASFIASPGTYEITR